MSKILCLENKNIENDRFVTPKEFLEWAKQDLLSSDKRACGNALGNIKKSIHCRIDEIIHRTNITYGENWNSHINTPKKLEILKKIGNELPRRKRTGYHDQLFILFFAPRGGEFNPK